MARGLNLLSARFVATVTTPGKYADGGGLYLMVRQRAEKPGKHPEKLWVFRYKEGCRPKPKEFTLSLGKERDVTLASARDLAAACRAEKEKPQGDPRNALRAKTVSPPFGAVADLLIEEIKDGFRNAKTEKHWKRTLGDELCRSLRAKPIADVTTEDVLEVLKPVWQKKPETARKMRARIERVLDSAKVRGQRTGENPARLRGHLEHILGEQMAKKGHHRALPWRSVPEFMPRLRALESVSAMALEWTVLTCARTEEAVAAPRAEINRQERLWIIPKNRTKENREHRVPLCDRCIEIFDAMAQFQSRWLFPARSPAKHLSLAAMSECLRGLGDDATVHGFRSTFRDWAGDNTSFPRELAEAALAHVVGNEAERAYRRGDALDRRRKMMVAWERYCLSAPSANVVELRG